MIYFGGNEIGSVKWGSLDVSKAYLGSQEVWSEGGDGPAWFTMKNVGTGAQTLKMSNVGDNVEYSSDGGSTWTAYVNASDITVGTGSEVMFRHNGVSAWTPNQVNVRGSTGLWKASGNIMTLLDKTGELTELTASGALSSMFQQTGVTDASELELPATTLAQECYRSMFRRCTALTAAPALPATTLANNCYYSMFEDCTSLSAAPALPATTLATNCYYSMFEDCTSLSAAPALPATTLAGYCYQSMFRNCTSLTDAPALPATTLKTYCYYWMFRNCTALTSAPALPATTLASSCYEQMFYGCSALSAAPALPATTLASSCYGGMFYNCTALTSAPALPATTLVGNSYPNMFSGCSALTCITTNLTAWNSPGYSSGTMDWLKGVAATGDFICPTALGTNETIERGASRCPTGWNVRNVVDPADGVEFKALENTVMSFGKTNASAPDISLQKSTDGGQTWSAYSLGDTISVPGGSSVKFKAADGVVNGAFCYGATEAEGEDLSCVRVFSDGGALSVAGDMSLLIDSSSTGATAKPYQFAGLFRGCDAVVDASALKLPDTANHSFY